ncbi:MAG: VWA domain-containing protein [Gammaproteobacteria bacterium]
MVLEWFPEKELNRDLYLWLAALAVNDLRRPGGDWVTHNQWLTRKALSAWPGLRQRYARLVDAHLSLRPAPASLKADESERERAIRAALANPGSVERLPRAAGDPWPVPLWLHPSPPARDRIAASDKADNNNERNGMSREPQKARRRRAERVASPEADRGLITIRMENILTWGEFVNVDRGQEDEDNLARAEALAEDLDKLSVARNRRAAASSLRFDLDLPPESEDDLVLDDGLLLPEWDWKKRLLLPDACRIVQMVAEVAEQAALPAHLGKTARRLRNQFQALAPARVWLSAQPDGQEIDIDACLRFAADREAGRADSARGLYRDLRSGGRDLACFLLADLSLSTDTWIDDRHRVIDVIRDALYLFAESLASTGDRFGIYGFSSRRNDPVRMHQLKAFDERYDGIVRGRIGRIKPGYYTRLGAGIRFATAELARQPANRRLLLILTDGKPNDIDKYEGRYGIEDTRHAVQAARRLGLQPFCVTIDNRGNDYLPHLFGNGGYVVIHDPAELPGKLPLLYARLTH